MIFIILWGEGDSANGNYPDAERERERYTVTSVEKSADERDLSSSGASPPLTE